MGQFREAPALAQLLQHERARARAQQRLGQEQVEQLEGGPHHLHPPAGVGDRELVVDQIAGQLGHDSVQHLARYDRRDPAFDQAQAGHVHIRRRPELDLQQRLQQPGQLDQQLDVGDRRLVDVFVDRRQPAIDGARQLDRQPASGNVVHH
uniref:Uncharacterized protein n=1 Tax=Anopheles melas TaxID=34690 RepID=A0A182U1K6_9DIPT